MLFSCEDVLPSLSRAGKGPGGWMRARGKRAIGVGSKGAVEGGEGGGEVVEAVETRLASVEDVDESVLGMESGWEDPE